jgi:hypothetical protein
MPVLEFYKQHAKKMSLDNAVAWVEASRRSYNKGSGERITFEGMLEIIDEDQGATGPEDWAAALAIHKHLDRVLKVQRQNLLKTLQQGADSVKVAKLIKEDNWE